MLAINFSRIKTAFTASYKSIENFFGGTSKDI